MLTFVFHLRSYVEKSFDDSGMYLAKLCKGKTHIYCPPLSRIMKQIIRNRDKSLYMGVEIKTSFQIFRTPSGQCKNYFNTTN